MQGVVVLNQLLHELKAHNDNGQADKFNNISSLFWLDGGHNGGKETWITQRSILAALGRSMERQMFLIISNEKRFEKFRYFLSDFSFFNIDN